MLMYFFAVLALCALALNIVVLISVRQGDKDIVENLEWSHGSQTDCSGSSCFDVYVGIYDILVTVGSIEQTTKFTDDSCTADYCEKCDNNQMIVMIFAFLSCFFCFPGVFTDFMRGSANGNTAQNKTVGTFTSFMAMCCSIVCLVLFHEGCQKYITEDTENTIDWKFGTAWIIMCVIAIIKAVDCVFNHCRPSVSEGAFHGV